MMEFARLIHQSSMTFLPTNFPVHFYGLPDGKVYLIFARLYEVGFERSGLEYVVAEHCEFTYDYEKGNLLPPSNYKLKAPLQGVMVDKPQPIIKIHKVYRQIQSYAEAYQVLNTKAKTLLEQPEETTPVVQLGDQNERESSIA